MATGCAPIYVEQDAPELPVVTKEQALYQRLVRNDMSVAASTDLTGDCDGCAEFAPTLAEHSAQRAKMLGGLWDPWDGDTPEGAPEPESVPAPATTWADLATKLLQTGLEDLVASTTLPDESQRLAVAAVASGRIADGFRLTNMTGAQEDLGSLAAFEAEDSALTPQQKNALATAVAKWDCTAQLIPTFTASDDHDKPSTLEQLGRVQVDHLLDLSATALAEGVADERVPYCTAALTSDADADLASVENELAATNLELFVRHFDMRLAGADTQLALPYDALISQLRVWGQMGGVPAVPGVQVAELPSEPEETSPTLFAPFFNPDPKPAEPGATEFQLFYNDEGAGGEPSETKGASE